MNSSKFKRYTGSEKHYCADCKYFHIQKDVSYSLCEKKSNIRINGKEYPNHICPSRSACKKYVKHDGKNHCAGCGIFLYPNWKFCPNCGARNPWKVNEDD